MDYSRFENLSDDEDEQQIQSRGSQRRSLGPPRVTTLPTASRVTIGSDGNLTFGVPTPQSGAAAVSKQSQAQAQQKAQSPSQAQSSAKGQSGKSGKASGGAGINYSDWDSMLDDESDLDEPAPRQYYEDELRMRLEAEERERATKAKAQSQTKSQAVVAAQKAFKPIQFVPASAEAEAEMAADNGEVPRQAGLSSRNSYNGNNKDAGSSAQGSSGDGNSVGSGNHNNRGGLVQTRLPTQAQGVLPGAPETGGLAVVWSQTKDTVELQVLLPQAWASWPGKAFQVLVAQSFDAATDGSRQYLQLRVHPPQQTGAAMAMRSVSVAGSESASANLESALEGVAVLREQLAYPVVLSENVPVVHPSSQPSAQPSQTSSQSSPQSISNDDDEAKESSNNSLQSIAGDNTTTNAFPPELEWIDDTQSVDWELVSLSWQSPSLAPVRQQAVEAGITAWTGESPRALRIHLRKTQIGQLETRVVLWWTRCFRSQARVSSGDTGPSSSSSSTSVGSVWEEAHRQFRELMLNRPPPVFIDPETGLVVDPKDVQGAQNVQGVQSAQNVQSGVDDKAVDGGFAAAMVTEEDP